MKRYLFFSKGSCILDIKHHFEIIEVPLCSGLRTTEMESIHSSNLPKSLRLPGGKITFTESMNTLHETSSTHSSCDNMINISILATDTVMDEIEEAALNSNQPIETPMQSKSGRLKANYHQSLELNTHSCVILIQVLLQ